MKRFNRVIQNLAMTINEEMSEIRQQTALSVLRILVANPQGYTEEEVALMAVSIADAFLNGLSKSPYSVKSRLESIQKGKPSS